MKKYLLILLLPLVGYGQVIKHHAYSTYWNNKTRCADSVSWNLGPQNICPLVIRKDKFAKDPLNPNSPSPKDFIQLPGYAKNKSLELAQGHLYSYESAMCNPIDNTECFYVDQMYEQYQSMNAGDWKTVEVYERQLAKLGHIHVIAGYIPTPTKQGNTIIPPIQQVLSSGLPIVSFMYKAIYTQGKWLVWIMPNQPTTKGHKQIYWQKTVAELNSRTGLKLK